MSKKSQFVVKLLKYKTMKNTQLERLQIPESRSRMLALTEPTNSPCVYVQLSPCPDLEWFSPLLILFTLFSKKEVKCANVTAILVLVTCARPEMDFIERFTSQFYDTFLFSWLAKWSFKLTNIICVIRGSIQTGSKDNLSLHWLQYIFFAK